jgi:hypothetical protein
LRLYFHLSVDWCSCQASRLAIRGNTLLELGDDPRAITVLEKTAATLEHELGADHVDTLGKYR